MPSGARSDVSRRATAHNFHSLLLVHQLIKSPQDLLLGLTVNMSTGLVDNPLLLLLWKGVRAIKEMSVSTVAYHDVS